MGPSSWGPGLCHNNCSELDKVCGPSRTRGSRTQCRAVRRGGMQHVDRGNREAVVATSGSTQRRQSLAHPTTAHPCTLFPGHNQFVRLGQIASGLQLSLVAISNAISACSINPNACKVSSNHRKPQQQIHMLQRFRKGIYLCCNIMAACALVPPNSLSILALTVAVRSRAFQILIASGWCRL